MVVWLRAEIYRDGRFVGLENDLMDLDLLDDLLEAFGGFDF